MARRERERERPRDWRWEQWEHWTVTRVGREGDQCQSNLSPMARERQETAANGSRSSASECGVRVWLPSASLSIPYVNTPVHSARCYRTSKWHSPPARLSPPARPAVCATQRRGARDATSNA